MDNQLIKIDTIWYKIKSFFKKLFNRKKYSVVEKNIQKPSTNNFQESISVKKELSEQSRKEDMALKLINDDIDVWDLTDEEVDEMTEWFKKDIEEKDRELNRIKKHILKMRKELKDE